MKREGFVLLVSVVGSLVLIIFTGLVLTFVPNVIARLQSVPTPTPGGIVVDQTRQIGDFTLTNQDGVPEKLSDLRGKVVLLFFGYTHCGDVCPLTMSDMRTIKLTLQENDPASVQRTAFVMISIDGARDTPDVMKNYVTMFDPAFIGLTGDPKLVANIGVDFGASFQIIPSSVSDGNYDISHTSFTYLLDTQGHWRMAYPFQTSKDLIVQDIERILAE